MSRIKFDNNIKTVEDALEASNLNFIAQQSEVMNSVGKVSSLQKMIYRSDNGNELGMVGMKYQPIQNNVAFALFSIKIND